MSRRNDTKALLFILQGFFTYQKIKLIRKLFSSAELLITHLTK
jgi:hypothetical protein